jgi:hypothetical protein
LTSQPEGREVVRSAGRRARDRAGGWGGVRRLGRIRNDPSPHCKEDKVIDIDYLKQKLLREAPENLFDMAMEFRKVILHLRKVSLHLRNVILTDAKWHCASAKRHCAGEK